MAAAHLFLMLLMTSIIAGGRGCPELCVCSDKYDRHFAECSGKELTEVPDGLPPNVTTISLSANKISSIPLGSFDNVTRVTSLWMAHNKIVSIEQGTLTPLVHLRNFDISHNKIVDFPWEDLQNLTGLQLLRMNHNQMVRLPRDAFSNLQDLHSLRLNNNKFITIAEGTFEGLLSLSHLQIYENPFACTCSLDWLRVWIAMTTIKVADQNLITCESPEKLKGKIIVNLPESKCKRPNVTVHSESGSTALYEGSVLVLNCDFDGNPKPLVMWNIHSKSQKRDLSVSFTEDDSAELIEDSTLSNNNPVQVFTNGTLIISHIRKNHAGNYSCSATNEFGRAEDSVSVTVLASPKPTPKKPTTTTQAFTNTHPPMLQTSSRAPASGSVHLPEVKSKDIAPSVEPTFLPTAEMSPDSSDEEEEEEATTRHESARASKCGLTANTRYVPSHVFNGSLDDVKQYTFDFGVIALGVSETEATVRLNPLLIPRDKSANQETTSMASTASGSPEKIHSSGLYLCVTADHRHSAVQWSRIREGINTYLFSGLRPATNYSLCLTYQGEDCEVQVMFTTRRRVPNLHIIISVSICLLTVSTVPLLGATCFHLVYKYRSKTYKLILKAKDQYHMERNLTANFSIHPAHGESERQINGSELDEEEGETESGDGEREADTEESVMTESCSLSQCKGHLDNCEVGSEYSDRLPLGAEAVNIISNYKYPNQ
ncbi:uncharacterized protein V6R79_017470 [Siganus canaliculatus]